MRNIVAALLMLGFASANAQNLQVQNLTVTGSTTLGLPPIVAGGCKNILSYGGAGDGSTDNTQPLINALAASTDGRACVYFPPGKFSFTSGVSYTLPSPGASVTIRGEGADVTELTWPNAGGGITVNYSSPGNSSHFRDMTISTGQKSGGNGIHLRQTSCLNQFAQSDIHRVTFRGADNNAGTGGNDYWSIGYLMDGVSGTSIDTVTAYGSAYAQGVGGQYQGSSAGCYAIYHNVSKATFNDLNMGVVYGTYSQGLTITQSNFQNGVTAIYVPPGSVGQAQLQVSDSQIFASGNGISLLSGVGGVMIHGNDFFAGASNSAVLISQYAQVSITGNVFNSQGGTGTVGIALGSPTSPGQAAVISGNLFGGLSVGVLLQAGSSNVNVQSNVYTGNTTNVDNLGSNNTIGGGSP